jgi:hypothetical protein
MKNSNSDCLQRNYYDPRLQLLRVCFRLINAQTIPITEGNQHTVRKQHFSTSSNNSIQPAVNFGYDLLDLVFVVLVKRVAFQKLGS